MTERVVMIGASGFGREALDVLEAMRQTGTDLQIVGVVDDGPSDVNLTRLADRNVAYLGTLDSWLAYGDYDCRYVVGIGRPQVRRQLVRRLDHVGLTPFTAVHPSATFGAQTQLEEGVVVCAGATVSTNVRLSRHVHLNPSVTIGHDTVLSDCVSVNPGAVISGEVKVGAETLVGASATILQNLRVGERTVVGAGAVVTKNIPDGVTVTGIPGTWTAGSELEGVK